MLYSLQDEEARGLAGLEDSLLMMQEHFPLQTREELAAALEAFKVGRRRRGDLIWVIWCDLHRDLGGLRGRAAVCGRLNLRCGLPTCGGGSCLATLTLPHTYFPLQPPFLSSAHT